MPIFRCKIVIPGNEPWDEPLWRTGRARFRSNVLEADP
jgi:hypothetical protein